MFKYRDCTYSLTTHLEISANKPKLNLIWFLAGRRPFSHVAEKLSAKIPVRRSAAWLKSELHGLIFVRKVKGADAIPTKFVSRSKASN